MDVKLDTEGLGYILTQSINSLVKEWEKNPLKISVLKALNSAVYLSQLFTLIVNPWHIQNLCLQVAKTSYPGISQRSQEKDEQAQEWVDYFGKLCRNLKVKYLRRSAFSPVVWLQTCKSSERIL